MHKRKRRSTAVLQLHVCLVVALWDEGQSFVHQVRLEAAQFYIGTLVQVAQPF